MKEETDSRSNFDSKLFYELCLKITIYSIYEVSLLRMRSSILVAFIDATMPMLESLYLHAGVANGYVENVPCTNKTQRILLLIMYVVLLKYTFVENFNTSSVSHQPIP